AFVTIAAKACCQALSSGRPRSVGTRSTGTSALWSSTNVIPCHERAAALAPPLSTTLNLRKSDGSVSWIPSSNEHSTIIRGPFGGWGQWAGESSGNSSCKLVCRRQLRLELRQRPQRALKIDQRIAFAAARGHDPSDKETVGADDLVVVQHAFQ